MNALKTDIADYRLVPSHWDEFKHLEYSVHPNESEIVGIVRFHRQVSENTMKAIFGIDIRCQPCKREKYKLRLEDYEDSKTSMRFVRGDEKTKRRRVVSPGKPASTHSAISEDIRVEEWKQRNLKKYKFLRTFSF